jgi:hypothetical protein
MLYNKDAKDVLIDFSMGQIKAMGKTSFGGIGGANQSRDYFWDVGIGLYKAQIKEMINGKK